jgi:tRNA(Ile)-lysidine synthetase-like protein
MIKIIKQIVSKKQHYFVSVSMGTDSVAAFIWLLNKKYSVTPIHLNHGLRDQNDLMQHKFNEMCEDLKIKGISKKINAINSESECRKERINFYSELGGKIITAHHLNDWVESYLLNCLRGKPNNDVINLVSEFTNFKIYHPFLLNSKWQFSQYLDRNRLYNYIVEDESNKIIKGSRRNWIRNKIIPEMKSRKLSLEKYALRKVKEAIDKIPNFD